MVAPGTSYHLENSQGYQKENGRFYVREETEKKLRAIVPNGREDIYMLAIVETMNEIKGLMEEFLLVLKRHYKDIV